MVNTIIWWWVRESRAWRGGTDRDQSPANPIHHHLCLCNCLFHCPFLGWHQPTQSIVIFILFLFKLRDIGEMGAKYDFDSRWNKELPTQSTIIFIVFITVTIGQIWNSLFESLLLMYLPLSLSLSKCFCQILSMLSFIDAECVQLHYYPWHF